MGIQIAPSVLAADYANFERDLAAISDADWVHFDVMDGHFVPNLTFGLPVLERFAQLTEVPIDAHLMISNPAVWAPQYVEAGAGSVTFHLEATEDPVSIAREIRAKGARAGVAVKPGTPVEGLFADLREFDMVLIMTVEPGFGGQSFMPEMMPKFRALRAEMARTGTELWVQADGGVALGTIEEVVDAGADVLVAGSAVYGASNPNAEIGVLRALANGAHHH